jgi:hypothetical protein
MKLITPLAVLYFIFNVLLKTLSAELYSSVRIIIYMISFVSLNLIRRFIASGPSVKQTVVHGIAISISYVYQVNNNLIIS